MAEQQLDVSMEVGWVEVLPSQEPEPEPEQEPQHELRSRTFTASRSRVGGYEDGAAVDPVRIWVGSWNTAVNECNCEELCGPMESCTPEALQRMLDTFARFVPTDCEIYIMGLQEGSPDCEGEYFFSQLELYLRRLGVAHVPAANGHPGKIYGRGDGSFISPKFTGIRVYCRSSSREHVSVVGAAGASAGINEGSKGAVGALIRVKDTTLLAISCHLAKHDMQKRRDQYGDICRKLAEGLAASSPLSSPSASTSPGASGLGPAAGGVGDLHSQYHHIIWFGDMNYHVKKAKDGGCTPDEAISCIRDGQLHALYPYDELFEELDLIESPQNRRPLCFCGFSEPEKFVTGPLETRFYPTYKKDSKRGTAEAKGGRRFVVPHREADIEAERDWVRRVYKIDYAEHWYKGGGVKLRMPSWTDRILYRSMPHLQSRFVPATRNDTDRYRAVNEVLLSSDHSPISCVFELQPEDCRTEPHYSKMTASQLRRAQSSQELKQLRLTIRDASISRSSERTDDDNRQPPDKMVAQFPGPYETALGVTHTTGEIFGSGAYALHIAAVGALAKTRSQARARPGLDLVQSQAVSSSANVGGYIKSSVPTVPVSNTSMDDRLNYTLSVRVWPPQPARPLGVGCGWTAEDTLGAAFNLPVMEALELSKPKLPPAGATKSTTLATQAPGSVTSLVTPNGSTIAQHGPNRGGEGTGAGTGTSIGGAESLPQGGPTRAQSSFHPDGGVYLSAPLLMMPPSALAGRETGFYLRLHLKLEGA